MSHSQIDSKGRIRTFLRELYSRTDPPELEQGFIRVAFAAIALAYLLVYAYRDGQIDLVEQKILIAVLLYFGASTAILAAVIWAGDESSFRRYLSMVVDIAVLTYFMVTMGEAGAVMFGLYLFLIFGYGFRFGRTYLHACQAMALVGFGFVLALEPHWSNSLSIGLACFLAIMVLPFYVGKLAQRIVDAKQQAEEASATKTRLLEYVSRQIGKPIDAIIAEYNASVGRKPQ